MYFLTIFTPTYNRGYILSSLYKSLCQQSDNDFLWLIVDDGSQDDTRSIVENWQKENKIKIKYIYQQNAGKHVAHNHGVEVCNTDLFFCVDSDDTLTSNAVETIKRYWEEFLSSRKTSCIMGFCTRKHNLVKKLDYKCLNNWPKDNTLIYPWELTQKFHYKGETALVWITKELKKYSFPVVRKERFVTEIVLYNQFKKPMLLKSERFYEFSYQPDGYTIQGIKLMVNNPIGTALMHKSQYYVASNFFHRLKEDIKYYGWLYLFHISPETVKFYLKDCKYDYDQPSDALYDFLGWICHYFCALLYKRKINKKF